MQDNKDQSRFTRFCLGTLTFIIVCANIAACGLLLLSSYAGNFKPVDTPILGVMPMLIPLAMPAVVMLFFIDIIAWRRTAIFAAVCLLMCMPAILDVFPVHIAPRALDGEEQQRSWTLLTYNNYQNIDLTGEYPGDINPYASYILKTDADVVCLQENVSFGPRKTTHLTQQQIDSLTTRYPYVILSGSALCVFSKYKIEEINTGFVFQRSGGGDIAAYRLYIDDKRVTIFNVHLRSFGLSSEEKESYHDLTEFKGKRKIKSTTKELVGKLADAARARALQADSLVRYVKHFGGTNVVICGDFNDVPGCYTMRQLEDQGLKDVHGTIGFGYMNTYNQNRFYFCIDHVMWRGDFTARRQQQDRLPISDHYPLLTTFVWDK